MGSRVKRRRFTCERRGDGVKCGDSYAREESESTFELSIVVIKHAPSGAEATTLAASASFRMEEPPDER